MNVGVMGGSKRSGLPTLRRERMSVVAIDFLNSIET